MPVPRRRRSVDLARLVRWTLCLAVVLVGTLLLAAPSFASSVSAAKPVAAMVSMDLDCKDSPTPDMPGQGLAGFFGTTPDRLPPTEDPFAEGATTTIYEQYGFAGLRWNTYDLGCGPDAARNPDAVIGTSIANWVMNAPVGFAALTSSLSAVSFEPTFLQVFDPLLTDVSSALHVSLFARWVPIIVALIGLGLLIKARGTALATAAAAVGWALFVVAIATALFRWPVEAGQVADETVTSSLASVVSALNGGDGEDPATAVASHVHSSVLYSSWLAGQLGSTDSETARKYGPALFKAQALTWREAATVQNDPEAGRKIIEDKRDAYGEVADKIRDEDPTAYEYLTGKRSDTRVAYAFLAAFAILLALPFLLVSALLLLGSFIIVRLAVMLFPAFATLGLFPSARGIVIGVGRTVGAALINAVIFGIGAAVTIVVFGVILDPATGLPGWLTLVLLPLFSLIMWLALKPFRRLTSMAGASSNPFGDGVSLGNGAAGTRRLLKKVAVGAASAYTGGAAAGAATAKAMDKDADKPPPERAEAATVTMPSTREPAPPRPAGSLPALEAAPAPSAPDEPARGGPAAPHGTAGPRFRRKHSEEPEPGETWSPSGVSESEPLLPVEPEWVDGEEVFAIYRPADDAA